MDDAIVPGKGKLDHGTKFKKDLYDLQGAGFTLRLDKCSFCQPTIKYTKVYLGKIIDAKGIRPHLDRLRELREMLAPKDIHQLRYFLGAVIWYGTFQPNLMDLRGPLESKR